MVRSSVSVTRLKPGYVLDWLTSEPIPHRPPTEPEEPLPSSKNGGRTSCEAAPYPQPTNKHLNKQLHTGVGHHMPSTSFHHGEHNIMADVRPLNSWPSQRRVPLGTPPPIALRLFVTQETRTFKRAVLAAERVLVELNCNLQSSLAMVGRAEVGRHSSHHAK